MLIVRDLRKRYGAVEAVQGVGFDVRAGEIFGLLGPNGAGKTTTLECVLGLREPDAGAIEVCGVDARRQPREARRRIGAALQTTALQDRITPREALALFASFYGGHPDPDALLRRWSLTERADAAFETLSGGQRQRLALALAFVSRPELVVLDEPTTGLDPRSRRELHDEILRIREEGHTVLLTTHDMQEAERLCDRVAIIDRGRIVAGGTPRELIARSAAVPAVTLIAERPVDPTVLSDIPHLLDLRCDATEVRFRTPSVTAALAALMPRLAAHGVEIAELRVQRATLEDVLLELTGTPGSRDPEGSRNEG